MPRHEQRDGDADTQRDQRDGPTGLATVQSGRLSGDRRGRHDLDRRGRNPQRRDDADDLGHSTIALTMNTYSHVIPALERDAADRMNAILSNA